MKYIFLNSVFFLMLILKAPDCLLGNTCKFESHLLLSVKIACVSATSVCESVLMRKVMSD